MGRKIHALIYTDYHIRLAKAIAELPETVWYNNPKERAQIIAAEYQRQGMKKKYVPLEKGAYFDKMLKSSDIFFTTMRLNPDSEHTHPGFRGVPNALKVTQGPFNTLSSRIVLLNEVVLYDYPGYRPFGHALLAKSRTEYEFYKAKNPRGEIHLVGHPGLDTAVKTLERPQNIGVYLCLQRAGASEIADRILKDIIALVKDIRLTGHVLIKDHVSGGKASLGPVMQKIKRVLGENKIPYKLVSKKKGFYDVADNVAYGFVQGSLSCHFLLRRMGVESFYYTNKENRLENPFVNKSKMPPITFSEKLAGKYVKEDYDAWMEDMFVLDGKCSNRLVAATKGDSYDKA